MATNLTIGGKGSMRTEFDLQGALAASRNLGLLASSLPAMQKTAIATLRRRLPVEARRDIQREYNIPADRVRKDLDVRDTSTGIKLVGNFRGVGLINFGANETKAGVTARVFKGGSRTLKPSAFFATLGGSNVHVVERVGGNVKPVYKRVMKRGRYAGKLRQPLQTLYGPTVAQMLRKGDRPQRLADFAAQTLQKEIARLIEVWSGGKPIPGSDNGDSGDSDN